jgi:CHASE3 domain sensor protein
LANTALSYRNTVLLYAAPSASRAANRCRPPSSRCSLPGGEAETGQRGYVITGNDRYLEPFKAAERRIDAEVSRLTQLTRDNAGQVADVPRMQRYLLQQLDELRLTIAVRKENGADAARAIVLTDRGRVAMDSSTPS